MGNRAVITTKDKQVAVYLHWNGGRDTVEPLLRYCKLQGYRSPSTDCYGWARLCQVMGNFFGGTLSLGIGLYDQLHDQGDNGTYIVDGWKIVGREDLYDGFEEQNEYDFNEMLHAFDRCMPEEERLGEYIDHVEVPVSSLKIDDEVWMTDYEAKPKLYPVVGFGDGVVNGRDRTGIPYVGRYDHDGDFSWNINNYITDEVARVRR